MGVIAKNIIPAKQLEVAGATLGVLQYTANKCTTIIDKFTVTNTTVGAVTITLYLLPTSTTVPADRYKIVDVRNLDAHECIICNELIGHVLESGGTIWGYASAATSLTIRASGREIS